MAYETCLRVICKDFIHAGGHFSKVVILDQLKGLLMGGLYLY